MTALFTKPREAFCADRNALQQIFPYSQDMAFSVPQELYQCKPWNGSALGFPNKVDRIPRSTSKELDLDLFWSTCQQTKMGQFKNDETCKKFSPEYGLYPWV